MTRQTMADPRDIYLRTIVFEWLASQVALHGELLPRGILQEGLEINGERVRLLGPQGIFKPRIFQLPLSLTTTSEGPYNDHFGEDQLLRYSYRGTDPTHRDNEGLRTALQLDVPLVYFHGIVPGQYLASWPVYVVGADPQRLQFTVAVDDAKHIGSVEQVAVRDDGANARRQYVTSLVRRRLHQTAFRERVLSAYHRACAFCRFRHAELLDAAHIVGDTEPLGEPTVSNGLALCRLHHAAFDRHFIGVRPDLRIAVRPDLLNETDGPTLVHGIQALEGQRLITPRRAADKPNSELLDLRFAEFLRRADLAS